LDCHSTDSRGSKIKERNYAAGLAQVSKKSKSYPAEVTEIRAINKNAQQGKVFQFKTMRLAFKLTCGLAVVFTSVS